MGYKNKKYYNDKERLMPVDDIYPSIEKCIKNVVIYLTTEKDGNVHVEEKKGKMLDNSRKYSNKYNSKYYAPSLFSF